MVRACRKCGATDDLLARENLCRACQRAYQAAYYRHRQDELKAAALAWRDANPERKRQNDAAWYRAHREHKATYDVQYRTDNAERIAQRRAASASQQRSYKQARRARKRSATVERFTDTEIFERDGYRCYLCGVEVDATLPLFHPRKANLEHRTPLARGGDHSRANCATACWACNSRKGTQTDEEFRAVMSAC